MPDIRDRIRSDKNAFEELLDNIPGFDGYRDRELRRTADKLLRERLVAELDKARSRLDKTMAEWARGGRLSELDDIDRLSRSLAKARDNIRFADYGYTGFFDAIKIKEDDLDRLYDYDLSLRGQIDACGEAIDGLAAAGEEAGEQMDGLGAAIEELQQMVDRREEVAASVAPEGGG